MERKPEWLVQAGKDLRSKMSLPEVLLWMRLRPSRCGSVRFRRQHPVMPGYVVDFYCPSVRLIVEVDGHAFHEEGNAERDKIREATLAASGFRILRIPAESVLRNPDKVADWIVEKAIELANADDV